MLKGISQVLTSHLPKLTSFINALPDHRQRRDYSTIELVFAAIMLHALKSETRCSLNQKRKTAKFKKNYENAFKLRLPHMDTVTNFLEILPVEDLEKIVKKVVVHLLNKGLFHRHRLLGRYHTIAVDATGYASFEKRPNWPCPFRTSKNGKITWVQNILCAKLVLPNGLSIPLLTEWLSNEEEYEKQDCELKAFKRLAQRLKQMFPRLPICILADGLYPNGPFFDLCAKYNWSFIVVLKDGKLKNIWKAVEQFDDLHPENKRRIMQRTSKTEQVHKSFRWINDLTYQTHQLSWVEGIIKTHSWTTAKKGQTETKKHVFVTNLSITKSNVAEIIQKGRLRWNIENEGFNAQKNGGYKLKHKMSRVNFNALQNFHTCLQLGHLINQLLHCSLLFKTVFKGLTLVHCWQTLNAFLLYGNMEEKQNVTWSLRYG